MNIDLLAAVSATRAVVVCCCLFFIVQGATGGVFGGRSLNRIFENRSQWSGKRSRPKPKPHGLAVHRTV